MADPLDPQVDTYYRVELRVAYGLRPHHAGHFDHGGAHWIAELRDQGGNQIGEAAGGDTAGEALQLLGSLLANHFIDHQED